MLISEVVTRYLENRTLHGCRVDSSRGQVGHTVRLLGGREAGEISYLELESYRASRRAERTHSGTPPAESTINRELAYLRAAMRQAWRRGLLAQVPPFPMGPESPPRMDFATAEQARAIIGALRGVPVVADVVEFLWTTGWRLREATGLRWEEVRWAEGRVVLTGARTKTRAPRILPIAGPVRAILARRELERRGPWVFHRSGRQVRSFRRPWLRACRAAGVEGLRVHGLRRSLARRHLLAGVPQAVTMTLAGWRTDAIYRRYAIVDEGALRRALEA